ncbi:probable salivary secreted peptide [Periplaneta americana]|uniref:probable salivary secreted peptide n=1 Tax=Periplaneta americana TaxID=6978 RepID=UPI0037E8733A
MDLKLFAISLFVVIAVASGGLYPPYEPSPHEYGIIQQGALRNNSHNLVAGWRQYGDVLMYRGVVKKSYKFMGTTTDFKRFPPWGVFNRTITNIVVEDQYSEGTGGYVNITSGGVGYREVALSFKSQFNRGLKYLVSIYGK